MDKSLRIGNPADLAGADELSNNSVKTDAQGRPPLRGSDSLVAAYLRR